MSVERIVHEGSLLAVILRIGGGEPGARFVTESDAPSSWVRSTSPPAM
jgi:hypothetical protein